MNAQEFLNKLNEVYDVVDNEDYARADVSVCTNDDNKRYVYIDIQNVPKNNIDGCMETIPQLCLDAIKENEAENCFFFTGVNEYLDMMINSLRNAGFKDKDFAVDPDENKVLIKVEAPKEEEK